MTRRVSGSKQTKIRADDFLVVPGVGFVSRRGLVALRRARAFFRAEYGPKRSGGFHNNTVQRGVREPAKY